LTTAHGEGRKARRRRRKAGIKDEVVKQEESEKSNDGEELL